MDDPQQVTEGYAVTGQLYPEDMAEIARRGFTVVINNRPDGEAGPEQPTAEANRAAAEEAGLVYHYLPMTPDALSPDLVARFHEALAATSGPALAHCKSGMRSTLLWALSEVRHNGRGVDVVLGEAARAGFDFEQARPLMEHYAAQSA